MYKHRLRQGFSLVPDKYNNLVGKLVGAGHLLPGLRGLCSKQVERTARKHERTLVLGKSVLRLDDHLLAILLLDDELNLALAAVLKRLQQTSCRHLITSIDEV